MIRTKGAFGDFQATEEAESNNVTRQTIMRVIILTIIIIVRCVRDRASGFHRPNI